MNCLEKMEKITVIKNALFKGGLLDTYLKKCLTDLLAHGFLLNSTDEQVDDILSAIQQGHSHMDILHDIGGIGRDESCFSPRTYNARLKISKLQISERG